ncbi:MAG: heavy-metal-associated domain-containing protein [bacterium]
MIKKITLKLSGMHCISCSMNIDSELEDLTGVVSVNTSYPKSETKISYDDKVVSYGAIERSIQQLGYGVDQVASA